MPLVSKQAPERWVPTTVSPLTRQSVGDSAFVGDECGFLAC